MTTVVLTRGPGTLPVQGLHAVQHLVDANRRLADALARAGVVVANVEPPRTDHARDPVLPQLIPVVVAALRDLERFLAVLVADGDRAAQG